VEVGAWQGLKPAVHPKHLRGAEALLFHGKAVLVAFFSNLLESGGALTLQLWLGDVRLVNVVLRENEIGTIMAGLGTHYEKTPRKRRTALQRASAGTGTYL
jgi:hypothetical protein